MAKKEPGKIGWAHMLRDVLVESMRRGQLPLLAFAGIIALLIWKTPEGYYPELWAKVFELKGSIMAGSLFLNFVLILGWYFNAKSLRRRFQDETERVIQERNKLQSGLGVPVKSSNK
jgi:hypothetical protein